MKFAFKSDRGNVRETNEDCCNIIAGSSGAPAAFILADGMGGHNSGEVASKTAVDYITDSIVKTTDSFKKAQDVESLVKKLICDTNLAVYDKSVEFPDNRGMGTTLILALVLEKEMYIGHVGDSRLYLVRDGSMSRVTTDHSYIEELVRNGSLTREEASSHPGRNIITRAVGCSEVLEVDTYRLDMLDGDCYLLCTDGLTNMLDEDEIMEIVCGSTPEAACEQLVDSANKRGGEDNITVIVIKNE